MNSALIVVDMQKGFVNEHSNSIIPNILNLIDKFLLSGSPVIATRFLNYPDSGYVRWIHWNRLMNSPEIDLIDELEYYTLPTYDKRGCYTPFSDEFSRFLLDNKIDRVYICGIATDSCVLKTAVDAFERGIEPIVVSDSCASHAGDEIHQAGLTLIKRFIGKNQVIMSTEINLS